VSVIHKGLVQKILSYIPDILRIDGVCAWVSHVPRSNVTGEQAIALDLGDEIPICELFGCRISP
jgi:hypothetical protein